MEQAVSRAWSHGVDPQITQGPHCGAHHLDFFAPDRPAFACVRVEPGDRQPRVLDAEVPSQSLGGDEAGIDDLLDGQASRHLRQGRVHGDQRDPQSGGRQHHHGTAGAVIAMGEGQFAEELGVAGKGKASAIEAFLGDGRGHDAAHGPREGQTDGGLDPGDHGLGRPRRRDAGDDGLKQRDVNHRQGLGKGPSRVLRCADATDKAAGPAWSGDDLIQIAHHQEGRPRMT